MQPQINNKIPAQPLPLSKNKTKLNKKPEQIDPTDASINNQPT